MSYEDLVAKLNKKMIDVFGLIINPTWIQNNRNKLQLYLEHSKMESVVRNIDSITGVDFIKSESDLVDYIFWMILSTNVGHLPEGPVSSDWIINNLSIPSSMLQAKYSEEHVLNTCASEMLRLIYRIIIKYDNRKGDLKQYILRIVQRAMELRANQYIESFFKNTVEYFVLFVDKQIKRNLDEIVSKLVEQDIGDSRGGIRTNFLNSIPTHIDGEAVYKGSVTQSYKELKKLILGRTSYNVLADSSGWEKYVFYNLLDSWLVVARKTINIISRWTNGHRPYTVISASDVFENLISKLWAKHCNELSKKYFSLLFHQVETKIMRSIDILLLEPKDKIKRYIKLNLIDINMPDDFITLNNCVNGISLVNTCDIPDIDNLIKSYNSNKMRIWNEIIDDDTLNYVELSIDGMFLSISPSRVNSILGNSLSAYFNQ